MVSKLDLAEEMEKLSPVERIRVIDQVIRNTITPDPEVDTIWVNEAIARWKAFERGEVEPVPYEAVMSKYREK